MRSCSTTRVARVCYSLGADANLDGVLDAGDTQLLYADLGYLANQAPTGTPTIFKTHLDLETHEAISQALSDPEGDALTVRITGTSHGTAQLSGDGHTLIFNPESGFIGVANVTLIGDDGYTASDPVTVSFNISDAPLINLELSARQFRLTGGQQQSLTVIGDFADEQDVVLPASYLTFDSSTATSLSVSLAGRITALTDGYGILSASSHGIQAATSFTVGFPSDFQQQSLYIAGLDIYPQAVTLVTGGTRQMLAGLDGEYPLGSCGLRYPLLHYQSCDRQRNCRWIGHGARPGLDHGHRHQRRW